MPTADLLPPLADPDDLRAFVPGLDEARADRLIRAASARFRAAVRLPVSQVVEDEVWLDGNGERALLLPAAPVTDVHTVEVDGQTVAVDWSPDGVVVRTGGCWPRRLRAVRVVYTHGYDPVPDDVQDAVIGMGRFLAATQPGVSSMQVGGQTVSTSPAAVDTTVYGPWRTVVDRYQLNRGDAA